MHKTRPSLFLLLVLVAFGLSLALPAEDLAEAAYDESETMPSPSAAHVPARRLQSLAAEVEPAPAALIHTSPCAVPATCRAYTACRCTLDKPSRLTRVCVLRC